MTFTITKKYPIDANKIFVSKKEPYGTKKSSKYFIKYNDNDVIRPLCVTFSQMTDYAGRFDENAFQANTMNNF